jgi:hypothetical protein
MTTQRDPKTPEGTPTVRRPYVTPKMVVLGQVRDLTLAGGTSVSDSMTGATLRMAGM